MSACAGSTGLWNVSSDTLQTIMVVGSYAFVMGVFQTIFQVNAGHWWMAGVVGTVSLLGLGATWWAAFKDNRS